MTRFSPLLVLFLLFLAGCAPEPSPGDRTSGSDGAAMPLPPRSEDWLACHQRGDRWGFVSVDGEERTEASYGLAWSFNDGLARVINYYGFAFITPDGDVVLQLRQQDVRDFSEGMARVQEY